MKETAARMAAGDITAASKQGVDMKNFENLDQLPAEVKIMIVNGQRLADETRKAAKGRGLDLTSRLQLRDDCAAVEKIIEKIRKGKFKQKDIDGLEPALIRLRTSAEAILRKCK